MHVLRVECYSGYRADERPVRFTLGERTFQVEEVEDRWYAPEASYFRVRADDGNFYVLRHDETQDAWSLDAFRAARSSGGENMPMATDKRLFERIYLEEDEWIPCEGIGFVFYGRVAVIGVGGLLIRSEKTYNVGTVVPLRLQHGLEVVEADCIVRDVEENGFGVEFVKFRGNSEDHLREIVEDLRS